MLQDSQPFFTEAQLKTIVNAPIPRHIAIVPDGNRRWAQKVKKSIPEGHRQGARNLIQMMLAAKELGVKAVTFYGFSTENWSRDPLEVRAILWLLQATLINYRSRMVQNGIRFHTIGDLKRFPQRVQGTIQKTKDVTALEKGIDMVLALNYGSRDEICRAIQKVIVDVNQGKVEKEAVTESLFSRYLDTASWSDPELFIRTSGEERLSNFLLWQLAYAEIYTMDTKLFWPEFTPQHLLDAIVHFQKRERRFGG